MNYPKTVQTTKTVPTKKKCRICLINRDMRFFSSVKALECGDCKRRKWVTKLRNRPAKVNKRLDTAWALAVKERDGFKCAVCGSEKNLNSHHIFSRQHRKLRLDLTNGITLCASHHMFDTKMSAHKAPTEFVEWLREYLGTEAYEHLREKAKQI